MEIEYICEICGHIAEDTKLAYWVDMPSKPFIVCLDCWANAPDSVQFLGVTPEEGEY